eukprot:7546178-Pyramimonas_sp.AAC.1
MRSSTSISTRPSRAPIRSRLSHRHGSSMDLVKPSPASQSVSVRCHKRGASLRPYTGATNSIN